MCQRIGNSSQRDELRVSQQMTLQPFEKRATNFVGTIQPQRKKMRAWYIIMMIEYLSQWAEPQPVKDYRGVNATKFLFEYVLM